MMAIAMRTDAKSDTNEIRKDLGNLFQNSGVTIQSEFGCSLPQTEQLVP